MVQSRAGKTLVQMTLRLFGPIAIFVICAWVLAPYVATQTLEGVLSQLSGVPWFAWLAATSLSIISLWSVGRYDGVAHRHFATGIPDHQARWSGTISISLAQTLGFGLFTGALARWRMLPNLSLATSFKLSAFVSLTFVVSWAIITALACVMLPAPKWSLPLAYTVLALVPVAAWLMFRTPRLRLRGVHLRLTTLTCSGAILIWTAVDTIAAASVLFVLLPNSADIAFTQFLPLFLLALGTALLSNTPGGVGPFELMMIGLFPTLPAAELLTSILAFRVVYYAVPAALAGCAILLPFRPTQLQKSPQLHGLYTARNAELAVIAQNGGRALCTGDGSCAVWPTGQTLTALCNPIRGSANASLKALRHEARMTGKLPMVYKCDAQTAIAARQMGWSVMHISDDAMLDPLHYDLQTPTRRRLRRKLRSVEKAGVQIIWQGARPWAEMARIDQAWQAKHGTARGGTMGRFEPVYLSDHFIACAYKDGRLCAFASFQCSTQEWCLDVMRHTPEMPDGTMHALVHQALICAKAAHIPRLSLAAVLACPDPNSALFRWAARLAITKAGGTGLRQFKSIFAPRWAPRYAAAPNATSLMLGLADIAREVHHPPKLSSAPSAPNLHEIHNGDEDYVLASRRAS